MAERTKPTINVEGSKDVCLDCPVSYYPFEKYGLPILSCKIAQVEKRLKISPTIKDVGKTKAELTIDSIPEACPNGYSIPFENLLVIEKRT